MSAMFSRRALHALLVCLSPFLLNPTLSGQADEQSVEYILERYIDGMGGRAALERIKSVRLSGIVEYPDGSRHSITVLKKKPDRVRVVLDTGTLRFIQAYNGQVPWFARESGRYSFHDRMRGELADSFIREAPLENVLINPAGIDVDLELGPDVSVAGMPCFQIIAHLPGGAKVVHHIEKDSFLERRILEYDKEGELISELVPGKFQKIDGVAFAMKIVRLRDGETISTLTLDEVETNVGILDSAFDPPVDLPPR